MCEDVISIRQIINLLNYFKQKLYRNIATSNLMDFAMRRSMQIDLYEAHLLFQTVSAVIHDWYQSLVISASSSGN